MDIKRDTTISLACIRIEAHCFQNVICIAHGRVPWFFSSNRKVAVSVPAGVGGFFIDIKSFRSYYGPGIDSASNRNEHQEYFLGVKAAGA